MSPPPLRAGNHHVVVVSDDYTGLFRVKLVTVDAADPHDHAVGRRGFAQPLLFLPAPGRHKTPVLFEGSRIEQLVDILTRAALPSGVPFCDLLRPKRIVDVRSAFFQFCQIIPDVVGVDRLDRFDAIIFHLRLPEQGNRVALVNGISSGHADPLYDAALTRLDHVSQSHRLHDSDRAAGDHAIIRSDIERDDGALCRCGDLHRLRDRLLGRLLGFDLGVVIEESQRVLCVLDLRTGVSPLRFCLDFHQGGASGGKHESRSRGA